MTIKGREHGNILRVRLSLGLRTAVILVVRLVAMAFLLGGGVSGIVRSLATKREHATMMDRRA